MSAVAFMFGVIVGIPLTWLAARLGPRIGLMDRPASIKIHTVPIAHTGGAALLATTVAGTLLFSLPVALVVGAVLTWTVGFADDVRGLSPRTKLAALVLPLAVSIVSLDLSWPERLLAIGAGVVAINAFNVIDGLDGLAAGVAIPPLLVLAGETQIGVNAALIAGAVVGFMVFNLPPARIFLGDEGSLLLGFLLWMLPLTLVASHPAPLPLPSLVLLWAFPLANLVFVTGSRIVQGRPILVGDRSHLYDVLHRRLGLTAALTLCWSLAAIAAVLAVMVTSAVG